MRRVLLTAAAMLAAPFALAQAPSGGPSPEMQAAIQAVRTACQNDVKQYCSDKEGRAVFQCLRANSDKVSGDCKDAMAKLPARRAPAAPPPQ